MNKLRLILLVLIIQAAFTIVEAATITVMRDGSGDYTRIQPALDAVASGDTLLIGPGEYFEYEIFEWPGYSMGAKVYAWIPVDNLTIIGAGPDETVIGPRDYIGEAGTFSPKGMAMVEGNELVLRGVTLRNCYDGLHADNVRIDVENCHFYENYNGLLWLVSVGGKVSRCLFESSVSYFPNAVYLVGQGGEVIFEGCDFQGCKVSDGFLGDFFLNDCTSQGSNTGISVKGNPLIQCFVNNCFISSPNAAIAVQQGGAHCTVRDSELFNPTNNQGVVGIAPFSKFYAINSSFSGGEVVFFVQNSSEIMVNECHILSTGDWAIYSSYSLAEPIEFDFRNNFWGTDNSDEIAAMIFDGNDEEGNFSTVLFDPYSDVQVPTEQTTWGDLKAMYR